MAFHQITTETQTAVMTPDLIAAVRATVEAMQNAEDGPWIATFFRSPRGARQSWCIGSPNGSQQIAGRVHDGETAHAIATVGNLIIQNGPAILAALERLEKLEAGAEESVAGKRRDAEHRADVDLNHGLRARLERVERAGAGLRAMLVETYAGADDADEAVVREWDEAVKP